VLDVTGISPVTDFLVIATGTSARQMRTVVDDVAEYGEANGFKPYGAPDTESDAWLLVDFVHVVVHVFNSEARMYYDLDSLWGDAKKVDWEK
jgi:ribosome-associated protein